MKREITGLLWGVLFLSSGGAWADTHIPGGFVSGTWTVAGSPYILDGNVVVHQDSTLTIEPGADVLMDPGRRFRVEGQILAVGTQQDSIRFVATDTTHGSEGLDFLNTNLSPRDSSKLVYCEIKYGTASPYPDPYMHGGGLYIKNSSRLLVSHCLISHCRTRDVIGANGANGTSGGPVGGGGHPGESVTTGDGGAVYCEYSNPAVMSNTFSYNHTGYAKGGKGGQGGAGYSFSEAAYGGDGGHGGNGFAGAGGAICLRFSDGPIESNIFCKNSTGTGQGGVGGDGGLGASFEWAGEGGTGGAGGEGHGGSGGALSSFSSSAVITNDLVYRSATGSGLGADGGDGGDHSGYIGSDGDGGPGGDGVGGHGYAMFADQFSSDDILACTITDHSTLSPGLGGAGGLEGGSGSAAPAGQSLSGTNLIFTTNDSMANSIFWNNADPTISPTATIAYSCIQGGFPGIGNINVDPLFVSTPQGNYFLSQIAAGQTQQSPCVDAGSPMTPMIVGTTRTDGVQDAGVADMGYHYPLFTATFPVSITLTPYGTPIIIPANGGSFSYNIAIANSGSSPTTADVWCDITLPNGHQTGPTLGPVNLTLPAGFSLNRDRTQNIPRSAPSGNYTYNGYVGVYPGTVYDQDSFPFSKSATGDGPAIDNWDNTGESFADGMTPTATAVPESYTLGQNYPNPFNPITSIIFGLPKDGWAKLAVYDLLGREVAVLVNAYRPAGTHETTFDASALACGIYVYRLTAGDFSAVKKMVMMK